MFGKHVCAQRLQVRLVVRVLFGVRTHGGGGGSAAPPTLALNDEVVALFTNDMWYGGRISAVNADGTFAVQFDDGDRLAAVTKANIIKKQSSSAAASAVSPAPAQPVAATSIASAVDVKQPPASAVVAAPAPAPAPAVAPASAGAAAAVAPTPAPSAAQPVSAPVPPRRAMHEWTESDVKVWLHTLPAPYHAYCAAFELHGVDGSTLLQLKDTELVELGVAVSLHRIRILSEVAKFKAAPPAANASASASGPTVLPSPLCGHDTDRVWPFSFVQSPQRA